MALACCNLTSRRFRLVSALQLFRHDRHAFPGPPVEARLNGVGYLGFCCQILPAALVLTFWFCLQPEARKLDRTGYAERQVTTAERHSRAASDDEVRRNAEKTEQLNRKGVALYRAGRYLEALPIAQRVLAMREKVVGLDHRDIATLLENLGLIYRGLGRYVDAEPLFRRALEINDRVLDPGEVKLSETLTYLADACVELARYDDAEPFLKRAFAIREKALGPSHPDSVRALNNLALLYERRGDRTVELEELHKRELAIRENAFGADNIQVVSALDKLAEFYSSREQYAEAASLYERVLEIYEKSLSSDHPNVAAALNNIADVYESQGINAAAERLYNRSLSILEKAFGPKDSTIATVLNNLAYLYYMGSRYADAERLYKQALAIRDRALKPDDPEIARNLSNLGGLYAEQRRYTEAEPLLKRALEIEEKALGPDDTGLHITLNNLAGVYRGQGRYYKAEPLFKRALAINEKWLGLHHAATASALNNLAAMYRDQGRYAEAEPLFKQALAIKEKAYAPDGLSTASSQRHLGLLYRSQRRHFDAEVMYKSALATFERALGGDSTEVHKSLNEMALLYSEQGRYAEALPLVHRIMAGKSVTHTPTLPVLFGAQTVGLISERQALEHSLYVVQRAGQTAAADALNSLFARFTVADDRLARLIRKEQDLANETTSLDRKLLAAISKEPSKRNISAELRMRDRITAIDKERGEIQNAVATEFPNFLALWQPPALALKAVQSRLGDDEALVLIYLDVQSYVWVFTAGEADWKELAVTANQVADMVSTLRTGLDVDTKRPFDTQASFKLYQQVLGPVDSVIRGKTRLSLVLSGPLTSLPPQVLVTGDPAGKAMKDVDWLIRRQALTVLPSLHSLKVLRGMPASKAKKPLVGFANPVLKRQPSVQLAANVTAVRGIRGSVLDVGQLKRALLPLPQTADELRQVAASVNASKSDIFLGSEATEARIKQMNLEQYRIVYFATHGLVGGEVADFAKLNAEPALVLSVPEKSTELDNGLLTASEVARLKLDAEWVVLSACNTASGDRPGAEPLSGLARAFFYAGGRSLLVSYWSVETHSAVALMVGVFAAIAADPRLSHGEALQKSMLALVDNPQNPTWADPKFWAPFVVVGETAKLPN